MSDTNTIIVGAGMAGMTCALELKKAGVPYTLISPNIGGRVMYLKEYDMNFGAVFYMGRYTHARELLIPGKLVLPSFFDLECHKTLSKGYGVLSGKVIATLPQLLKFFKYLTKTFQPAYGQFKADCEVMEVSAAMEKNPYIGELFAMPAEDLITQVGFAKAADAVVSQFVYACTGTKIALLNALDYLNCAQGMIDESTRFSFDPEATRELLAEGGRVIMGEVAQVEKLAASGDASGTDAAPDTGTAPDDAAVPEDAAAVTSTPSDATPRWRVTTTTDGETITAQNLVMAAPADVTQRLLQPVIGSYEIRKPSELHAYKVRGKIKSDYAGHPLHLFDQSIPLINIGARPDGAYEVFTCEPLDMGIFFKTYTIEHQVDWPKALFTNPALLIDQCVGDGLYRAGDHNALGMEPAAISGLFVANKILGKA